MRRSSLTMKVEWPAFTVERWPNHSPDQLRLQQAPPRCNLGRVALAGRFGVDDRGVEIPDHLGIRHLRYNVSDQLRDIRVCRRIALARVELGRDREIAGLGEAPADVLDVFVDTKDFLNNQDGRKRPARYTSLVTPKDRILPSTGNSQMAMQTSSAGWRRNWLTAGLMPLSSSLHRPPARSSKRLPRSQLSQ